MEGTIPADVLGGMLYRCGPGNFERGDVRYNHIIDGDGFVYAITLGRSGPTALGRFVRTAEFVEEEANDNIMFRSSFGTQPGGADKWRNVFNVKLKNLANTTAVFWGKGEHARLLALFEAGLPYKLSPDTLETHGLETFSGELRPGTAVALGFGSAVDEALGFGVQHTAHPHVDPVRRRLVAWWSQIAALEGTARITVREWDEEWKPKATTKFDLPTELVPHDFCLTASFYVWCENRLTFEGRTAYLMGLQGPAEGLQIQQGAPNRIHLVARSDAGTGADDGLAPLLTVETPPWFCIHHSHAEEQLLPDGDRLISVYSAGWKEEGLASGSFLSAWAGPAPDFQVIASTYYWKTVVRVAAGGASAVLVEHGVAKGLETACIDHPHVDPRIEARLASSDAEAGASRYCFMSYSNDDDVSGPPLGWLRLDLATGATARWATPRRGGQIAEELVVVPKASSAGSWLLGMLSDARRDQSCLCILDGDRIEEGPVARVWLPARMAHGLHGWWAPASVEDVRGNG